MKIVNDRIRLLNLKLTVIFAFYILSWFEQIILLFIIIRACTLK
jgi:hypothetical protein